MPPTTVPGQLLAAIKSRKFTAAGKLFATPVDFEAWTPSGHWVAEDAATVAKILEVWFTPGTGSTITWSNETSGARGAATLEYEIAWKALPDDQPRVLREVFIMTIKGEKIVNARVYCAGLHTEFPEVDLDKQRRSKGLGPPKAGPPAKAVAAKAS
jgi:hypothetical protein